MVGDESENRKRFYFPDVSQTFAGIIPRKKTQICTIGDVGDGFSSLPIL